MAPIRYFTIHPLWNHMETENTSLLLNTCWHRYGVSTGTTPAHDSAVIPENSAKLAMANDQQVLAERNRHSSLAGISVETTNNYRVGRRLGRWLRLFRLENRGSSHQPHSVLGGWTNRWAFRDQQFYTKRVGRLHSSSTAMHHAREVLGITP